MTLVAEHKGVNGGRSYSGDKHKLKGSQAYPPSFGRAVRKLVEKNEAKIRAHKAALKKAALSLSCKMVKGQWDDANAAELMTFLVG